MSELLSAVTARTNSQRKRDYLQVNVRTPLRGLNKSEQMLFAATESWCWFLQGSKIRYNLMHE